MSGKHPPRVRVHRPCTHPGESPFSNPLPHRTVWQPLCWPVVGASLGEEASQEAVVLMHVFSCRDEMCWHRAIIGQLGAGLWSLWVSFHNCGCQLREGFLLVFQWVPHWDVPCLGGGFLKLSVPSRLSLRRMVERGVRCVFL